MAAVAVTTFSASSQLYVTGGDVSGTTYPWTPNKDKLYTCPVENGYYTFKANGDFKISKQAGSSDNDWDTFNENALTLNGSWSNSNGTYTASLTKGDADIPAPANKIFNYRVKTDYSVIEATESGEVIEYYYGIHGQIFGNSNWSTTPLTQKGDNYELTADIVPGEFGIKKCSDPECNKQSEWIGGNVTINETDKVYTVSEGANSRCNVSGRLTIIFNPTNNTIEFKGESQPVELDVPDNLYLLGTVTEQPNGQWNPNTDVAFTKSDKSFTIENINLYKGDGSDYAYFSLTSNPSGDWGVVNANRFGPSGSDTPIVLGEAMEAYKNENSWMIDPGCYNMTVDFSGSVIQLTVTKGQETPGSKIPEALYAIGYVNGNSFNPTQGVQFGRNDNTFTLANVTLDNQGGNYSSYFGLTSKLGADENDWSTLNSNRYGAESENQIVELNTAYKAAKGENSWRIQGGEYTLTVVFDEDGNATLTVTGTPDPLEAPENLYLIGGNNGWNTTTAPAFTKEGDKFTLTDVEMPEGSEFTLITKTGDSWDSVNDGDRYGAPVAGTEIEMDQPMDIELFMAGVNASGATNWTIPEGKYNFTVDFSTAIPTLTVSVADNTPAALYIFGTFNEWMPSTAVALAKEGKVFSISNIDLTPNNPFTTNDTYFCFITKKGVDFSSLTGSTGYGATKENVVPSYEGDNDVVEFTIESAVTCGDHEWMVEAGVYDITVSFEGETPVMTIGLSTGGSIDTINSVEEGAIYFNLQGNEVVNPEKGVYIRVINGKASKVMF